MRALLTAAGGAPAALPGAVAGRLVAVEPVVQTEAVRRRIKFLGHLPLNGVPQGAKFDSMRTPNISLRAACASTITIYLLAEQLAKVLRTWTA